MDTPPVIVVDLDGTLIASDVLVKSLAMLARKNIFSVFHFLYVALTRGRACAKTWLADRIIPDASSLPYQKSVTDFLAEKKAGAHVLILASASDQRIVKAVAEHVGLFDHYFGTTPERNLKGAAKRECIEDFCHGRQYGYIGNSWVDMPIWETAAQAYIVSKSKKLIGELKKKKKTVIVL